MAIQLVPNVWSSTAAYSVGDRVLYNGVRFENIVAVTANPAGAPNPIVDTTSWEFNGVQRIVDYYSLQYAIMQDINKEDQATINQIPLFIQNVERKLSKILRSPAQKWEQVFTVDADSKFQIPIDLLEVIHIRRNEDSSGYDLRSQASTTVQKADRTTFEELRQRYTSNGYRGYGYEEFEFPVYRIDEQFIYIAPDFDNGDEFRMQYYQYVPELGSTVGLVDDMGNPINDQRQTITQWIAAGNSADTFVQDLELVTTNLWTETTPHLLKEGALIDAYRYLNNDTRAENASNKFSEVLALTVEEFSKLETSGSQSLVQRSGYNYN